MNKLIIWFKNRFGKDKPDCFRPTDKDLNYIGLKVNYFTPDTRPIFTHIHWKCICGTDNVTRVQVNKDPKALDCTNPNCKDTFNFTFKF